MTKDATGTGNHPTSVWLVAMAFSAVAIGIGVAVLSTRGQFTGLAFLGIAAVGGAGLYWIIRRLRRHPAWLYVGLLWSIAIAPAFQLNRSDTFVSDAIRLLAYALSLVIILIAVYWTLKRPQDLTLIPADIILLGLVLWQFVSLLVTEEQTVTLTIAVANILAILSCTLALRLFVVRGYVSGSEILVCLHILAMIVTIIGLLLLVTGPVSIGPYHFGNYLRRSGFPFITSVYAHGNALGGRLFIGLIATIGLWTLTDNRRGKLYYVTSVAVMGALLVLTFSRSAYLGLAIGAVIILWRRTPHWFKIAVAVAGTLTLLVAYQVISSDPDWAYRFKLGSGGFRDRSVIWLVYLRQLATAPLTGIGFSTIYHEGRDVSAHNAYLGMTVQFGVVGFLLFAAAYTILMLIVTVSQRLRTDFSPQIAWIFFAMVVAISVQQLFEARLLTGVEYTHLVFWISVTIAMMPFITQKHQGRRPGARTL